MKPIYDNKYIGALNENISKSLSVIPENILFVSCRYLQYNENIGTNVSGNDNEQIVLNMYNTILFLTNIITIMLVINNMKLIITQIILLFFLTKN